MKISEFLTESRIGLRVSIYDSTSSLTCTINSDRIEVKTHDRDLYNQVYDIIGKSPHKDPEIWDSVNEFHTESVTEKEKLEHEMNELCVAFERLLKAKMVEHAHHTDILLKIFLEKTRQEHETKIEQHALTS